MDNTAHLKLSVHSRLYVFFRHCPDSRRTFTKRLMLEKHIQLMHGIKEPDMKEMAESTNMGESSVKEDTKVSYHVSH